MIQKHKKNMKGPASEQLYSKKMLRITTLQQKDVEKNDFTVKTFGEERLYKVKYISRRTTLQSLKDLNVN